MRSLYKGLILAALLFILPAAGLYAHSAGSYKITVKAKEFYRSRKGSSGSTTLYLRKHNWIISEGVIIDSSTVGKNFKATFKGSTYSLDTDISQDKVFTAGQYDICDKDTVLLTFFYSPSDGRNFRTSFTAMTSRTAPYCTWKQNRAGKEDKDSLEEIFRELAHKGLSADNGVHLQMIADERLLYTSFGKRAIDSFLDKFKTSPEKIRNMAIDYLMENKYLTNPKMKAVTAWECFRRYSGSIVMGCEGSAVYAAEKYILGNPEFSIEDMAEAGYYVRLNRNTLVGKKAPDLNLKDTSAAERSISQIMGEYSIIYFYSDDCIHCEVETPRLIEFLDNYRATLLNVWTVYTGTDAAAWKKYVKERFSTVNPFVNWVHTADIERESLFPLNYGITSTPRMFLLDQGLKIIGRGILTPTISQILETEHQKSNKYFEYLKAIFPEELSSSLDNETDIRKRAVDKIAMGSIDNPDSFCELLRHTFVYLMNSSLYPDQEAAAHLGDKYVCQMPQMWEDTAFVSNVCRAVSAFSKNKLGSKAANLMLYDIADNPSELLFPEGKYRVLIFYKTSCGICTEMAPQLLNLWRKYGSKVSFTGIYAGQDVKGWRKYVADNSLNWRQLYDKGQTAGLHETYETETVPHIYLIDPNNVIIAKDIDTKDLEMIISSIIK